MRARTYADERGMSLIEVMAAAFVLAIGVLATLTVILGSRDLTTTSEKLEAATHVAEKELEGMASLTWAAQAHAATPASGPAPYTVTGSNFQWQSGSSEPLAVTPGIGAVAAAPTPWSDGRRRGTVYRFVSWVDDACCSTTQDYKRLTVIVSVDGRPGISKPVVVSTFAARKEGV
jgi:prepilin-type N-terminal cleavage/methylation domain-containing protein